MALIRRRRFILTNQVMRRPATGYGMGISSTWTCANVLQHVDGAVCWRCKRDYRRGDNLVHVVFNSSDAIKPDEIYHYRCIPSARWHVGKLAGSLPAWELLTDESPALSAGTSSAAGPTFARS